MNLWEFFISHDSYGSYLRQDWVRRQAIWKNLDQVVKVAHEVDHVHGRQVRPLLIAVYRTD